MSYREKIELMWLTWFRANCYKVPILRELETGKTETSERNLELDN